VRKPVVPALYAAGNTQREIAEKLGVDQKTVCRDLGEEGGGQEQPEDCRGNRG
jgi:hypothetical protein